MSLTAVHKPNVEPSSVRRTTMQHVDGNALRYFETVSAAQTLYTNMMQIALDPLITSTCTSANEPLHIMLRIDVTDWTTAQQTLTVKLSPTCSKTFVLKPGKELPAVPMSVLRATSINVEVYNNGEKLGREGECGACLSQVFNLTDSEKSTIEDAPVTIKNPAANCTLCTMIRSKKGPAFTFNVPFFAYQAEELQSVRPADVHTVSNAFATWVGLQKTPLLTPSRPLTLVNASDAERLVADCEDSVLALNTSFDAVFDATALQEFGSEHAQEFARSVDWSKSYTVSSDDLLQQLITRSKCFYTLLTKVSNTGIESNWLTDKDVCNLVSCRQQLAQSVEGRRSDLGSVSRVRCTFMCIDAIDNDVRHVCRLRDTGSNTAAEIQDSLEIPCHRYWLEQTRHNLHNSVPVDDKTYADSAAIMDKCKQIRDDRRLLPVPCTHALKSTLGAVVWQSMHMQGLAAQHIFPIAPCAHFLYKNRARVDYTAHPVVAEAQRQTVPLALMCMFTNADAEHRIIPPPLCSHILTLLANATAKNAAESTKEEAANYLRRVLDPLRHSLATAALSRDTSLEYDLSFILNAGTELQSTTVGYDTQEVTNFCLSSLGNV
jgi:hypothetical protein